MKNSLFLLISSLLVIVACSPSTSHSDSDTSQVVEVSNPICFNHAVLVLDSVTYFAAVNSPFIQQFAFSRERQLNGYKGFYLFGKTNYIELFHPKSFDGYEETEGGTWICLAALEADYITRLKYKKRDFISYSLDDQFHELSLILNDSTSPIALWEMTRKHYENWTNKPYNSSMQFSPVDYNSPTDADSSSHYLMNDIQGIGLTLHPKDSADVLRYLHEVGFRSYSEMKGHTRVSNKDQFFELHFSNNSKAPTIHQFYISLNKSVQPTTEIIGNSTIEWNDKIAVWTFGAFKH